MPSTVSSSIKIFADDTKIYRNVSNDEDRLRLQSDLDAVTAWSASWLMPFNAEKCTTLHIGSRNPVNNYSLGGVVLGTSSSEKD